MSSFILVAPSLNVHVAPIHDGESSFYFIFIRFLEALERRKSQFPNKYLQLDDGALCVP